HAELLEDLHVDGQGGLAEVGGAEQRRAEGELAALEGTQGGAAAAVAGHLLVVGTRHADGDVLEDDLRCGRGGRFRRFLARLGGRRRRRQLPGGDRLRQLLRVLQRLL